MAKQAARSFLDLIDEKAELPEVEQLGNKPIETSPPDSMVTHNVKSLVLQKAKKNPPDILDPESVDILKVSNEKTVLRRQIARVNHEIKNLEERNEVSNYLLDLRKTMAVYLKIWLDHEHRSRDLETQDLTDLQQILTSKLDRLTEIALSWGCLHCSDELVIAFQQVVSE